MSPQKTHGERIGSLEIEVKQTRKELDEHRGESAEYRLKINETHVMVTKLNDFLLGDDYNEKMNGGFVKFVKKLALDVKELKRRREWLKGAWWGAGLIIGVLTTLLGIHWDKIFH
jgi:hypothetical protein